MSASVAVSGIPATRSAARPVLAGPAFLPCDLPGIVHWCSKDFSLVSPNGMLASSISDASGLGNHATQATSSLQPTLTRADGLSNELRWSQAFENVVWTAQNGLTPLDNQIAGPLSESVAIEATKVTSDGTLGGRLLGAWQLGRTGNFTLGAFFKDGTAPPSGTDSVAWATDYTIVTGATSTVSYGNGYNLRTIGFEVTAVGTFFQPLFYPCSNGSAAIGAGQYGYIFGAFLHEGSAFLGYAPTTASLAYSGIAGNSGFKFDATDDVLDISIPFNIDFFWTQTQKTMFVVLRTPASLPTNKAIFVGRDTSLGWYWGFNFGVNGIFQFRYRTAGFGSASPTTITPDVNSTCIIALRHDNSTVKGYINSLTVRPEVDASNGITVTDLGSRDATSPLMLGDGGVLAEVICQSGSALPDAEFNRTMNYLAAKYAVTLT